MKKFTSLSLAALAAGLLGSGVAMAADGTITFNGKITDQTCDIVTPGGKDFTVTLPTVSTGTLSAAGAVAGRTPFAINLENCSKGKVATYFEPGPTVDFETGRLLNQASAGATNVQIQLLGSNNNPLPVLAATSNGAQTNSQWVDVANDGEAADLNYYAEYYATDAAGAGDVTTSVQYTIIYQ
ncbi:fimbrial protein [Isoalcanivorax beigongshangi]|uniref:Fimbrial protein n=1 Tax=Isoalcanivorax beigongshangi TaxID=3238810 RepID=A0ABV4AKZ5_9GAMM